MSADTATADRTPPHPIPGPLAWTQHPQLSELGDSGTALLQDPDQGAHRFRLVLMSVIVPVNLVSAGPEGARLSGCFHPGRYRGIAEVQQIRIAEDGAALPIPGLVAGYRSPQRWFPHRLWRATGSLPDTAPTVDPGGRVYPDPGVNLRVPEPDPAEAGEDPVAAEASRGRWAQIKDCRCQLRGRNRIADLRHGGRIHLRAVEVLRFTGRHRDDSMDFLVAQLALETPHAADLVDFRRSLRTGEPTDALRQPSECKHPHSRQLFSIDRDDPEGPRRRISASALVEFHLKAALLEGTHLGPDKRPDHRGIAELLLDRAEGQDLNLPEYLLLAGTEDAPHTSVTFAIEAGHTQVRDAVREDNDAWDRRRLFTVAAVLPVPGRGLPACPMGEATGATYADPAWTTARQWGLLLATGADRASTLPPDTAAGADAGALDLREGWADYVTGWGAVTLRTEDDPLRDGTPLRLAQTRDVDLAILAMRQLSAVELLAERGDRLASTTEGDIGAAYRDLTELQRTVLDFRKNLWFGHVPRRPTATAMLRTMQDRLGIPAQLAELTEDLTLRQEILAGLAAQRKAEEHQEQERRRERERSDREDRRAAEAARDRADRERQDAHRNRVQLGLAVLSLLVTVPSFTGALLEPSPANLGAAIAITAVLALLLVTLNRRGKLTCFFNRLLGIPEPAAGSAGPGERNRPAG
ncbi:hypothetical protein [Corynebacterium sphenisci]|uniref:hypothetical protein n=1 Tax=Corynebacterium sphenisci TaxID=191493 RepID=UPI0026DF7B24|nr:hypothetical protein [Corynebacterium sphenisci]MDO5731792.1 hypothetical protein [Corynebacterium sphenisci]